MSKKKTLNNIDDKTNTERKYRLCWYCQLHGKNILDKYGCCKRCGTNLKRWKSRSKLKYPNLSNIENEVLGIRQKTNVSDIEDEDGGY